MNTKVHLPALLNMCNLLDPIYFDVFDWYSLSKIPIMCSREGDDIQY